MTNYLISASNHNTTIRGRLHTCTLAQAKAIGRNLVTDELGEGKYLIEEAVNVIGWDERPKQTWKERYGEEKSIRTDHEWQETAL